MSKIEKEHEYFTQGLFCGNLSSEPADKLTGAQPGKIIV